MRIKFRAWDKENKEFLKAYREQHIGNLVNRLLINMDGSLIFHEDDGLGGGFVGGESIEERFELMKYTGNTDKNGNEIYEDDLVAEEYGRIYRVVFKGDCWRCEPISRGSKNRWLSNYLEIIGNIYENAELLGDRQ